MASRRSRPASSGSGTDDGNVQVYARRRRDLDDVGEGARGVPAGTYVEPRRAAAARATAPPTWPSTGTGPTTSRPTSSGPTTSARPGTRWPAISPGQAVARRPRAPEERAPALRGHRVRRFRELERGASWTRVRGKLPTVPVFDLQVHPRDNDLIVATHGRGIYILDDLGALAQADPAALDARRLARLPTSSRATVVPDLRAQGKHRAQVHGRLRTPPEGATITYFLKSKPGEKEEVKIPITRRGRAPLVREIKGPKEKGIEPGELGPALRAADTAAAGERGRIVLRTTARAAGRPRHLHGQGDGGAPPPPPVQSSWRRTRASRSAPPSARNGSRRHARAPSSGAARKRPTDR